jgi:hypothetical protein
MKFITYIASFYCTGLVVLILMSTILTSNCVVARDVDDSTSSLVTSMTTTAKDKTPLQVPDEAIHGGVCGNKVCNSEQFCCNKSCSICAPIDGGFCHKMQCNPLSHPTVQVPRRRRRRRPRPKFVRPNKKSPTTKKRSLLFIKTPTISSSSSNNNQPSSPCILPKWIKTHDN